MRRATRAKILAVAAGAGAAAGVAAALPGRKVQRVPAFAARPFTVVGHRGARGHAPENTLLSLRRGLELGAHALELDLRLSADGHVVVMHDPTVDRTTDGAGPVAGHKLDELRRLDAGYRWRDGHGRHPFRGQGLTVPTLEEVLDALPEAFLVLELKPEAELGLAPAVAAAVRRAGRQDTVLLASEDGPLLETARTALPAAVSSLSEPEARRLYWLHLAGLHRRWDGAGQVLQVPEVHEGRHVLTPRLVSAAHALDIDVQVWTVNEAADLRRLVAWGVDGVVTDYPDRAIEAADAAGPASTGRPRRRG